MYTHLAYFLLRTLCINKSRERHSEHVHAAATNKHSLGQASGVHRFIRLLGNACPFTFVLRNESSETF